MDREELVEAMAEELWQSESARATDRRRLVPWSEAGEPIREGWRFMARAALAVAEPAVREDERTEQRTALKGMCPFDRPDHGGLLPEDPCPICGDLGTLDTVEQLSRCVSGPRTGGTP